MSSQVSEYPPGEVRPIDGPQQRELCQQIRRLIQDHSLELAQGRRIRQDILDEALRNVWVLEQ